MSEARPKIALLFRYGPAEHAELFHAMPHIVTALARKAEVHYFGLRSVKPVPEAIRRNAALHHLPFTVRRTDGRDKAVKTLLWLFSLPFVALRCRFMGVRALYIDETVPLTAPLARLFFGKNVAFTIADFFVDIYSEKSALARIVGPAVKALDWAAWRKLPLIFTRAGSTKTFLVGRGFDPARIHPVFDPCDFDLYHPGDRDEARRQLGLPADRFILVHHGILHPNKANDRIIRAVAELVPSCPDLHYLLVGDGSEMPALKALVRDLKMEDHVTLTGWLPKPSDVRVALNAGDVGLVMRAGQQADDFHMTGALVHNMACGLPILSARLGGVGEVIRDGENGLLFAPGDMEEFKRKLLQYRERPDLRREHGKKAAELARELFDMERVMRLTVEPLLKLAGVQP